jgi:anti-sigma regulatory factor (Ser/Thr protein kinase)
MSNTEPLLPAGVHAFLLSVTFDGSGVTDLRHTVTDRLERAGLDGQHLDDFVLAINELITNAIRHGGGQGRLRLWREGPKLLCEVEDHGTGIATERLGQTGRPAAETAGGWGLWLAKQLSETMAITTTATGTTVRISSFG